jgi:hypothetical protein
MLTVLSAENNTTTSPDGWLLSIPQSSKNWAYFIVGARTTRLLA